MVYRFAYTVYFPASLYTYICPSTNYRLIFLQQLGQI